MKKEYGNQYFEVHQKMIAWFTELMKKLWAIVDEPKTHSKEKIKAISLIMQCYNNKFVLINLEPIVKEMKRYLDETKMKEKRH
jgi:hypothetical protein